MCFFVPRCKCIYRTLDQYKSMSVDNEYFNILRNLYDKSLILESINDFDPVLYFYFLDALSHLDFTLCQLSFNFQSPRNLMNMQYLRWRLDEEKTGDRPLFPAFINWLKKTDPERFERLPLLWQVIYDSDSPACYRSFRIVLDPNSYQPIPGKFFLVSISEFFDKEFLKTLYTDGSLGKLFGEYRALRAD
jgi:hypothetical protein